MALELRVAERVDVAAVVVLMNRAFRGVGPDAGWSSEAGLIAGDRTSEALLIEEMAGKPEANLLVAEVAGDAAVRGCVWLERVSEGTWYLGSLTIDPVLQNAGLGRELLAAAERWAVERGAHRMRMTVVNARETLIAWYERRGYRTTGETRPFPYGDGRFGRPLREGLEFVVLEKEMTGWPSGRRVLP